MYAKEEKEINIVNIDPINKGPYILETLKIFSFNYSRILNGFVDSFLITEVRLQ